jgi:hypothetical protein
VCCIDTFWSILSKCARQAYRCADGCRVNVMPYRFDTVSLWTSIPGWNVIMEDYLVLAYIKLKTLCISSSLASLKFISYLVRSVITVAKLGHYHRRKYGFYNSDWKYFFKLFIHQMVAVETVMWYCLFVTVLT